MRVTLVSNEIAHYERFLISVFEEFFASIDKILILAERLGTRFRHFPHMF